MITLNGHSAVSSATLIKPRLRPETGFQPQDGAAGGPARSGARMADNMCASDHPLEKFKRVWASSSCDRPGNQ